MNTYGKVKRFYDRNLDKYLWQLARRRAKEKGLEFTIEPSDIKIVHECPILLIPLEKHVNSFKDNSYSLDRVDPSKGYIPGNVRVISWKANKLKWDFTLDQLERLIDYMKGN